MTLHTLLSDAKARIYKFDGWLFCKVFPVVLTVAYSPWWVPVVWRGARRMLRAALSDAERSYLLQCGAIAVIGVVVLAIAYEVWFRRKPWDDTRRREPGPKMAFRFGQIEDHKKPHYDNWL